MEQVRWPTTCVVASFVAYISVRGVLTLPAPVASIAPTLLMIVLTISATWLAVRIVTFLVHHVVQSRATAGLDADSVDEHGTITRLTVLRYGLVLLIVAVGMSMLLMSMDMFRTLGIALLSSAGAAAVVIGIAGHAVLGNLIAGLQIALTRPFRIGDTVYIEDNWGRIEELRYTYVIVRTWDHRRVVFPIRYFNTHWFDNWSKTDPYLIRPIYLQVDYRADVQAIREKFNKLLRQDDDWAGERDVPEVLVTECGEQTMTLRLTCGGPSPNAAWHLSCRMRESIVAWLQDHEEGEWLPRQRIRLNQPSATER
jgi:small-conductance mechanosensitive channel